MEASLQKSDTLVAVKAESCSCSGRSCLSQHATLAVLPVRSSISSHCIHFHHAGWMESEQVHRVYLFSSWCWMHRRTVHSINGADITHHDTSPSRSTPASPGVTITTRPVSQQEVAVLSSLRSATQPYYSETDGEAESQCLRQSDNERLRSPGPEKAVNPSMRVPRCLCFRSSGKGDEDWRSRLGRCCEGSSPSGSSSSLESFMTRRVPVGVDCRYSAFGMLVSVYMVAAPVDNLITQSL